MTTLDEVQLRELREQNDLWSEGYKEASRKEEGGGLITQRHDLLQHIDRLQSELSALKSQNSSLRSQCRFEETLRIQYWNELVALKAALKAARPAIEAGIRAIQRDAVYADELGTKWYLSNVRGAELRRCENELRGLLSLSEP